jgi:curli biogenesis system outer membrane secretion channel CsgG
VATMRSKLGLGLAVAVAFLGSTVPSMAQGSKRIAVAVMDFEFGTIDNWWGQYDLGKGMADQVVDALVNDGTFRVIERKKLDTVLAEQDFSRSDRADPSAAKLSKVGKVLGVRYVLTGSITKFSTETRGGAVRVKGIGLGGKKAKSEVNLTVRLVDTTTGEILVSAKGHGESGKGGGAAFSKGGFGVGTDSEEWRTSGLGEAQERATTDLVAQIVAKKDRLE